MTRPEEFADPVLVPGPNVRSRFVDTEAVERETTTLVEEGELPRCCACGRRFAGGMLLCPDDGAIVVDPAGVIDG